MSKETRFTVTMCILSVIVAILLICILYECYIYNTQYSGAYVYPEIDYIEEHEIAIHEIQPTSNREQEIKTITKRTLNPNNGVFYGPSGKETYYNLPMIGVINIMRRKGYSECDYPYIIREDGVKCLGDYVIVAANLDLYNRGQIIETSLGQGIVCDTGDFVKEDPTAIDIAVNW